MKINEEFIESILKKFFLNDYKRIYQESKLIQYLDKKMGAVHGDSKKRRSLANIYAIYSILYFYQTDYFENISLYRLFEGYDYMKLFNFYRSLYGGSKLQNHALNSRVNGEFRNKFPDIQNELIIINNGKYLIHIDYIYVMGKDISKAVCEIIEKYIELLIYKDHSLVKILKEMKLIEKYSLKKNKIKDLLTEDAEARIFEIISYAILKNHYKNTKVFFGYSKESIKEYELELYKTGRTNANDGGIDFVMRPVGRFFQVTEVNNYDKYLLDMDKVLHFPITFVIKTKKIRNEVLNELDRYIQVKTNKMKVLEDRYKKAIEDVITINELYQWIDELENIDIDGIIRDIDIYYRLEMNIEEDEDDLE